MKNIDVQQIVEELQSLDMENPGSWPTYIRTSAIILASIAIVVGGFWFLVQPKLDELKGEQAQESTLFEEFETKQRKVAALDAYKEQLKEMERSFGAMLRQLPSKAEVANLLNDISQTRVAASLEEELFKPQADIPKDFYAELPNQIIVTGSYHQMGVFISGVAALPRIVTIDDVDIQFVKTGNSKGSSDLLRMQAIAKTYRYLDDDEAAAAKPTTAGPANQGPKP